MNRRGSTYLEVVAALTILGLAILTSTAGVVRARALGRRMEERAIAVQATASELARWRARGAYQEGEQPWIGASDGGGGLRGARGRARVERFRDLWRVRLELEWGDAQRYVVETLLAEGR